MTENIKIAKEIALKINDYKTHITYESILQWSSQFRQFNYVINMNKDYTETFVLKETQKMLEAFYISKDMYTNGLKRIIEDLDFKQEWENLHILDLQSKSTSQENISQLIRELKPEYTPPPKPKHYLYLDDVCFTGNRIKSDLISWINQERPTDCKITIQTLVSHKGYYWIEGKIKELIDQKNLNIELNIISKISLENRIKHINTSYIFWPIEEANQSEQYKEYITTLNTESSNSSNPYPLVWRDESKSNTSPFSKTFSNRTWFEKILTEAGIYIRSICPHLNRQFRPLGYNYNVSLGFGSPVITYHNISNTTPLAFWVGNPWTPLFQRRINSDGK